MTDYTPDTLRAAGGEFDCPDCGCKSVPQEVLDAHADAWEAMDLEFGVERKELDNANAALRQRLEEAKEQADVNRSFIEQYQVEVAALRQRLEAVEDALRYVVGYFDNGGLLAGCMSAEQVWPPHLMVRIADARAALAAGLEP